MSTPSHAELLALKRRLLVHRVALQRLSLRRDAAALQQALSPAVLAARGLAGVQRRPAWWLAGAAALLALRRLGTRRLLRHLFTGWQLWQAARGWRGGGRDPR